jgi:hypothetical protein
VSGRGGGDHEEERKEGRVKSTRTVKKIVGSSEELERFPESDGGGKGGELVGIQPQLLQGDEIPSRFVKTTVEGISTQIEFPQAGESSQDLPSRG